MEVRRPTGGVGRQSGFAVTIKTNVRSDATSYANALRPSSKNKAYEQRFEGKLLHRA
jgi:hypothetical protein